MGFRKGKRIKRIVLCQRKGGREEANKVDILYTVQILGAGNI